MGGEIQRQDRFRRHVSNIFSAFPPSGLLAETPFRLRGPCQPVTLVLLMVQGARIGPLVTLGWAHTKQRVTQAQFDSRSGIRTHFCRRTWAPPIKLTPESCFYQQTHSFRERRVERARKACSQSCVSSFCAQLDSCNINYAPQLPRNSWPQGWNSRGRKREHAWQLASDAGIAATGGQVSNKLALFGAECKISQFQLQFLPW